MSDAAGGHVPATTGGTDSAPHDQHGTDTGSAPHDGHASAAAPGGSHGHEHAEAGEPLGPIDLAGWTYALVGAAFGLVAAGALYVAAL